jgi:hypothetical protein
MTEFDTALKRAFAEAHEPADDGFSIRVGDAVARRERLARLHGAMLSGGATIAGLAIAYGLYVVGTTFGEEMLANAGLEIARAHSALSVAPTATVALPAQGLMQSLSAGMTQLLLIAATLAGGAVAYRATQD